MLTRESFLLFLQLHEKRKPCCCFLIHNQEEIAKTLEQKLNDVEQKERMLDQQLADARLVRIHHFLCRY